MVARDPLLGGLFENMVILEALKARFNAGKDANLYFFRDSNGMEIDLLQAVGGKLYPMEIKAARTYHKDFTRNIEKFQSLNNKTGEGTVIYAGEVEQKIGEAKLINFRSLTHSSNNHFFNNKKPEKFSASSVYSWLKNLQIAWVG